MYPWNHPEQNINYCKKINQTPAVTPNTDIEEYGSPPEVGVHSTLAVIKTKIDEGASVGTLYSSRTVQRTTLTEIHNSSN